MVSEMSGACDIQRPYEIRLIRNMHRLYVTGSLCDVVLVADDGRLRAHGVVLAAASSAFASLLKTRFTPPGDTTVLLPGMKLDVLKTAVDAAYTGVLAVPVGPAAMSDTLSRVQSAMTRLGFELPSLPSGSRGAIVETNGDGNTTVDGGIRAPPVKRTTDTEAEQPEQAEETTNADDLRAVNATRVDSASCDVQNATPDDAEGDRTKRKFTVGFETDEDLFRFIEDCEAELSRTVRFERTKPSQRQHQHQQQQDPSLCEECGKMFAHHSHYIAHRLVHTGDRPHGCHSCGRRFKTRHGLRKHVRASACVRDGAG